MKTSADLRNTVENQIRTAFRGVTLGRGVSLRQAQGIDGSAGSALSAREKTNGWSQIPLAELERNCIAHLDAEGFRYYIPALMLSILNHYEPASMRVIGTLDGLYPKKDDASEYHMRRYSLLNDSQKTAIAGFLAALPELVNLGFEDQKIVSRALRNYWRQYLQSNARE